MKEKNEEFETLTEAEMVEIKGGGRWVYENGEWIWKEGTR